MVVLVIVSFILLGAPSLIMSLAAFNKISCVILNKGACNCRSFMPATMLCAPSLHSTKKSSSTLTRKAQKPISSSSRYMGTSSNDPIGKLKASIGSSDTDESLKGKIKYMWKNYGAIAIGTYFGVYITTLSSIFLCVDLDIFNAASVGLDPINAIKKVSTPILCLRMLQVLMAVHDRCVILWKLLRVIMVCPII